MWLPLFLLWACTTIGLTPPVAAYNILGIFPTMAKSHYISGEALMKGLAAAGHNVTLISPFPQSEPPANFRDIRVLGVQQALLDFAPELATNLNDLNVVQQMFNQYRIGLFVTNYTLKHPAMTEFLTRTDEHFDLIVCEITLNEAMLGLGQHFGAPVIGFSPFGAHMWSRDLVGSPASLSHVPHAFLAFSVRMNFAERVVNTVVSLFERLTFQPYLSAQAQLYDEVFAADADRPALTDVRRNVSLVLLNQHFTLSHPQAYTPNMIEVGGIHLKRREKPEPLPSEMRTFVEEAKHGVIFVAMGNSADDTTKWPSELRAEVMRSFAKRHERILWQLDDAEDEDADGEQLTDDDRPSNVLIASSFPQDDVLAHPHVKLFITSGGLLSTIEALYHGVPVVGVPMIGQQYLNMAQAEQSGYGVMIAFGNLTEASLTWALNEVLGNGRYASEAAQISRRYRDQPMDPMQTAVYWAEYVVRHGGAAHMRSAGLDLPVLAYHGLDVFGFLSFAVGFVVYWGSVVLGRIWRTFLWLLAGLAVSKKKPSKQKKKDK